VGEGEKLSTTSAIVVIGGPAKKVGGAIDTLD